MVDFHSVIEKAVDGLNDNTPELRAKVYDRARAAISRQLDNINPPLSDAVKQKQLAKLEDAIRDIEDQHSLDAPSLEDELLADIVGARSEDMEGLDDYQNHHQSAPPPPPSQPPLPSSPPPQQRRSPPPAPPPPPPPQQPRQPRRQPAYEEPDYGPEDAFAEDYDEGYEEEYGDGYETDGYEDDGFDDRMDEPMPPPPHRGARSDGFDDWSDDEPVWNDEGKRPAGKARKTGSGRSGSWISTVLILIILIAIGAAVWIYRAPIIDIGQSIMALGGNGVVDDGDRESQPEMAVERTTEDAQPETRSAEIDSAPDSDKFTQRLLPDGREVDEGPARTASGNLTEEGKSMAALTDYQAGTAASANQQPAAATQTGADASGVSQKMFLYEEIPGQQGMTGEEGSVVWSVVRESPGEAQPPEPAIQAQVSVPSKGLNALITIKRNADQSLPASHLIEIVFALTESFNGSGIALVQSPAMKQNEQDRGDTLISVPAKITDSFFMIALNDYVEAAELNVRLLEERNWIDIPIAYGNGQHAVMALEKGTTGAQVFDQVVRAWQARSASTWQ